MGSEPLAKRSVTSSKSISRLLSAALLALFAIAASSPATAKAVLYGQGLLWRIEGFGHAPSYLFGTMHSTDERILRVPKPVLDAFDASSRFIFELIIPEQPTAILDRTPKLRLPAGLRLRDIVGEDAFARIASNAARYGIPQNDVDSVHPLAFIFVFQRPLSEWRRQMAGWAFLDQALQNEARSLSRPVYALETIEEQLSGFKDLGKGDIVGMLDALVEKSFRAQRTHEIMKQNYLARNLDAIFTAQDIEASKLGPEERKHHDRFMVWLLDHRNQVMVTRMQEHLAAGRAFVAVGAAHLPGKAGVLHLLERQGYRVTRLY